MMSLLFHSQRPWSEYDHEFTIMFRVGDGHPPPIPDTLSAEGRSFLGRCFVFQPEKRATASELLDDPFVKV